MNENIPYHIKVMASFIGLSKEEYNIADGSIEHFALKGYPPAFKKKMILYSVADGIFVESMWSHVSQHYYKLIGRWPVTPTRKFHHA